MQEGHLKINIHGPVLLLMGPIGNFFSRFARYLIARNVSVHKIMFPLHEFRIPKQCKYTFDRDMSEWRSYIADFFQIHQIKQVYMYGDFIDIHKIAIEEAKKVGIAAYVFELGYIRPNYVTLEQNNVNARSNLNKPSTFFEQLPEVNNLPKPETAGFLWRKIFMIPTFIQHALTDYPIISGEHKLQPKPSYLYYQLLGYARYHKYQITEYAIRKKIARLPAHFLVALQVSIDSQMTLGSNYDNIHDFITEVLHSFKKHAARDEHLVFKHHPRDRGYNNYARYIKNLAITLGIESRVFYLHDADLNLLYLNCKGVITVNSTVGLSSLLNNIPTKTMGTTFYNVPGLTSQGSLHEFWREPSPVDTSLFKKFYHYMIQSTQINADFHGTFPFKAVFPVLPHVDHIHQ
jgi:capsular polysaccharide export protein